MSSLNLLSILSQGPAMAHHFNFRNRFYLLSILFSSLLYGWVLAGLPLDVFKDRGNYLIYADQSMFILQGYWSQGFLTGLTNEPIWLLLNSGLSLMFEPEITLRIIIGVPASIVAYLVLRSEPKNFIWLLLFIFLPQVLKNHIVHLRQGVAVSFFLIGWFSSFRSVRLFLFLCAAFIHASFFFILALLFLTRLFFRLRLSVGFQNILFIFFGLALGTSLATAAKFLGARQADEYNFAAVDISGLGFIFWSIILGVFFLQGRAFMRQHIFVIGVLLVYLSTYFFIEVSARIFESALLILLFSGLQMTTWRRQVFIVLIVGYLFSSYAFRLDQSWLGFGVV